MATYKKYSSLRQKEDDNLQGIRGGIDYEKYNKVDVTLTGDRGQIDRNAPKPIETFSAANLHELCMDNIPYRKPTPVQKYAIPVILKGRDLMACAQTGSGKTGAYLLPVISNLLNDGFSRQTTADPPYCPLVCILSPTRELATQIFLEVVKFSEGTGLHPAVIFGGTTKDQTSDLEKGCHILVATPGKLSAMAEQSNRKISFENLQYLILDEADRLLRKDLIPEVQRIIDYTDMPPKGERRTLMFSATFPKDVQKLTPTFLNDYLFLAVGRVGGTCEDVKQIILQVPGKDKTSKLEMILEESGSDRTLVFVETKSSANRLADFLTKSEYPTTCINSDLHQDVREQAIDDFTEGTLHILVATGVAARGLDIDGVKHVINYDLPCNLTSYDERLSEYVNRVGRTGRIGNKGLATTFYDNARDVDLARGLVKLLADAQEEVPEWLEEISIHALATGYGQSPSQFKDQRYRTEPSDT